MRFRMKTHTFFFNRFRLPSTLRRSKTKVYVYENGGSRKRSPEWRFLKTEVQRTSVDGRKRRFSKTLYVTAHLHVPAGIANSVQACVVQRKYGRAKTGDENGCFYPGFRWSSVDHGKRCENANVDVNTFQETETEVFENTLVWTGPQCLR